MARKELKMEGHLQEKVVSIYGAKYQFSGEFSWNDAKLIVIKMIEDLSDKNNVLTEQDQAVANELALWVLDGRNQEDILWLNVNINDI